VEKTLPIGLLATTEIRSKFLVEVRLMGLLSLFNSWLRSDFSRKMHTIDYVFIHFSAILTADFLR
jgi:hypothetical protein